MQIERTVRDFQRKHNKSQIRANCQIPGRNNILDLFLTNIPSQAHETKTLPWLDTSEYDKLFHEIKVKRGHIKPNTRHAKSYKKAYWSDFNKDLAIFTNMFTTHENPNHLWDMFKAKVNRLSTLHIQQTESKVELIYHVSHEIVKLIRKIDKLYTQVKRSCSHKVTTLKGLNTSSQPYQNSLEMHIGQT